MKLNPNWLQTFAKLVELKHFTRTAEALNMTQPGVTQHIQKLEQSCGFALLSRFNKSFELTEQGRLVYQYIQQLQQQEQNLLNTLSQNLAFEGECKLACSGALALRLYPELLNLQQQHTALKVLLEVAPNQRILNQLQAGELDLGIVSQQADPQLFDSQVLGTEALCLVLPKQSAHDNLPQTLFDLGLVNHPDAQHYWQIYQQACGEAKLSNIRFQQLPIQTYINQLSQILLPVSLGLGFSILPFSAVVCSEFKAQLSIYQPRQTVQETLYLVQQKHRVLPARFETIRHALLPLFPQ